MAAKHRTMARPEKRVLARQEVERTGRRFTPSKGTPAAKAPKAVSGGQGGGFARDILAVFAFIGSIGLFCALWTFKRDDALAPQVENLIGPVGHRVASGLFGLSGVCAFLAPVALFYTSLALFVRGKGQHRARQVAGLVALAVSTSVLAHLLVGKTDALQYPAGGAIGAALGETLRGALSNVGSVLVMTAVAAGALIVATDSAFARLCVAVGRWTSRTAVAGWAWSVAEGRRQLQLAKERAEQRKQEKAEEEAAFAQALADAEEAEAAEIAIASANVTEPPEHPLPPAVSHVAPVSRLGPSASCRQPSEAAFEMAPPEENVTEPPVPAPTEDESYAAEADELAEEAARLARAAEERRAKELAEERAREAALRAARRARNAPLEDPAWTMMPPEGVAEQPVVQYAAPAVVEPKPEEKPRPLPILTIPAAPPPPAPIVAEPVLAATAAAAQAPAAPAEAPAEVAAPVAPAAPAPQPTVAQRMSLPPAASRMSIPPVASDKVEPIAAVSPILPVIIEPKAPPKPTKKDAFAFEGDTNFSLPPISLLEEGQNKKRVVEKELYFATAEKLREKLASFGIEGAVKEIRPGPVVTMYEFEPAPGIKISKIASLADDLAMAMEALKVRIVAPIPGKGVVGIEVPNKERETVYFREVLEQDAFAKSTSKIAMAIGKNIEGMPYITDLAKMPHLLIAGTTGSGKSVSVNAMIMSVLFKATPEEVRMIMVDPKVTELSIYEGIPHLLLPVVTDARKAAMALRWAVEEMERRYQMLAKAGVRNISGYNKWVERQQGVPQPPPPKPVEAVAETGRKLRIIDVDEGETEEDALARLADTATGPELGVPAPNLNDEGEAAVVESKPGEEAKAVEAKEPEVVPEEKPEQPKKLPYIVIVIDEVADLMMVAAREVETYVARLAQMARAAGIHLMIATQRPSTDVITGVIKANFPSRISFQLRSKPDSMTILGTVGAEALLGMGDMLILPPTSAHLERVHGAYVSDAEILKVVQHLKAQGKPVYDESILKPRDEEGDEDGEGGGQEEQADEMYDQCLALVSEMRQVSVSMLQRKLRLGYNRAARIIERMEREGVVGPANGSKPRDVLIRPAGEMHKEINL